MCSQSRGLSDLARTVQFGKTCFVWNRRRRRSTEHWVLARLACILLLISGITIAQRVVTATANIPFDFWAEGQKFAAGEYTFDTGFPGSTSVHRKGTKDDYCSSNHPLGIQRAWQQRGKWQK